MFTIITLLVHFFSIAPAAEYASQASNLIGYTKGEADSKFALINTPVQHTIIYPNGGTNIKPANISANSRYVMDNPFAGYFVLLKTELLIGGKWCEPGDFTFISYTNGAPASMGVGTKATQLFPDDKIIIKTGSAGIITRQHYGGSGFDTTIDLGNIGSAPCRVHVWKIGGRI